jgi:hypothetical protein
MILLNTKRYMKHGKIDNLDDKTTWLMNSYILSTVKTFMILIDSIYWLSLGIIITYSMIAMTKTYLFGLPEQDMKPASDSSNIRPSFNNSALIINRQCDFRIRDVHLRWRKYYYCYSKWIMAATSNHRHFYSILTGAQSVRTIHTCLLKHAAALGGRITRIAGTECQETRVISVVLTRSP